MIIDGKDLVSDDGSIEKRVLYVKQEATARKHSTADP